MIAISKFERLSCLHRFLQDKSERNFSESLQNLMLILYCTPSSVSNKALTEWLYNKPSESYFEVCLYFIQNNWYFTTPSWLTVRSKAADDNNGV